jgi:hypothetical protein
MTITERATIQRANILKAMASLNDQDASLTPEFFEGLKNENTLIISGTRINWNGQLKRAAVDLWDTEDNNPDNAPSLWEDIAYREGIRIIPSELTVGTAFAKDELGWWGEELYRSKVDNNVYTPAQYAANWELIEESVTEPSDV